MMSNNIVMFSHNNHSFIGQDLIAAAKKFDKVFYIGPISSYRKMYFEIIKYPNIHYYFFSKKNLFSFSIQGLKHIFTTEFVREIKSITINDLFSFSYLKSIFYFFSMREMFKSKMKILEKKHDLNSSNTILLSCWLDSTAYAISRFVSSKNNYKIISLVHSFEVDKSKNPFYKNLFRKTTIAKFNYLSFISKSVRDQFLFNFEDSINHRAIITADYLGVVRLFKKRLILSKTDFIFISCSHIVEVKRVDLIYKVLSNLSFKSKWIHIGGGKNFQKYQNSFKQSPLLSVSLLGNLNISQIHELYSKNHNYIFINFSSSEGIPIAIMESFAYFIPAIATDVGGNSEIVKNRAGELLNIHFSHSDFEFALSKLIKNYNDYCIKSYEVFSKEFRSRTNRGKFYTKLRNYL